MGRPPGRDPRAGPSQRRKHGDERADHRRAEPDQVAGGGRRREHLRHPGRRHPPGVRPAHGLHSIRHILVRHEQGAGHAAQGYAAATGKVGVCMATSGPGATNLVTPIADAHMDSVPMVAITGQVGASMIGTDAFQEADIRGITMPITKHNFLVTDPAEIPRTDRRGVPHRLHRPPRPGAGRRRQVRAAVDDHVRLADRAQPARLPPGDPPARQADPRGREADPRGAPPGALRRRRHDPRPRRTRAAGAGGVHRDAGRHHADGPRARSPTATRSTSACPACTAPSPRSPACSAAT